MTHVHDPTVDVAELFEAKKPRAMCGVIEGERLDTSTEEKIRPLYCGYLRWSGKLELRELLLRGLKFDFERVSRVVLDYWKLYNIPSM